MIVSCTVDWLHLTMPYDELKPLGMYIHPLTGDNHITPTGARFGYTLAGVNRIGAKAMSNPLRPDMGVHLSYSASTLRAYAEREINTLNLLRYHMDREARCSRIDLAIDIHDSDLLIADLYRELADNIARTAALSYTLLTSNNGGMTLYIGSRQSELFMRIYNKAAEQQINGVWERVELEAKGDKAQAIAQRLLHTPAGEELHTFQQIVNGYVTFQNRTWQDIMTRDTSSLAPANKRETDTVSWLINVAAPALGKHIGRTGDTQILSKFLRTVRINRARS